MKTLSDDCYAYHLKCVRLHGFIMGSSRITGDPQATLAQFFELADEAEEAFRALDDTPTQPQENAA